MAVLFGDKIRSQSKPFLYLFQLVAAKDPVHVAEQDIPLADLEAAREQLVRIINTSLTPQEREFLLSFKNYTPNWTQLGLAGIDQLPAVRWKLQNLARMKPEKHAEAYARLKDLLGM